jgi:hypothetical protein
MSKVESIAQCLRRSRSNYRSNGERTRATTCTQEHSHTRWAHTNTNTTQVRTHLLESFGFPKEEEECLLILFINQASVEPGELALDFPHIREFMPACRIHLPWCQRNRQEGVSCVTGGMVQK